MDDEWTTDIFTGPTSIQKKISIKYWPSSLVFVVFREIWTSTTLTRRDFTRDETRIGIQSTQIPSSLPSTLEVQGCNLKLWFEDNKDKQIKKNETKQMIQRFSPPKSGQGRDRCSDSSYMLIHVWNREYKPDPGKKSYWKVSVASYNTCHFNCARMLVGSR